MEALESLQCQPSLDRQHPHLCWREQEGGQATEQLGGRVAGLYPQAGCRVAPVVPGHATRDHRVEGLSVASNPFSEAGKVPTTWTA